MNERPNSKELRGELERMRYARRAKRTLVIMLLVFALFLGLIILFATQTMFIWTDSEAMSPTIESGSLVMFIKKPIPQCGEIVGFYDGTNVVLRRVISTEGMSVDISEDGVVYRDGQALEEPYAVNRQMGTCTTEFPVTVSPESVFVLSDDRENMVDSRNSSLECIRYDQIIGTAVAKVWPFDRASLLLP